MYVPVFSKIKWKKLRKILKKIRNSIYNLFLM